MEVDTQTLEFIIGLKKITNISTLMNKKVKEYSIHEKGVITTTKKDIFKIVARLNSSKFKETFHPDLEKMKEGWYWGEQKLFIWIVIYYAQALYIQTYTLEKDHLSTIYQLFPQKDQNFLRYEFVSTFGDQKVNRQSWCPQQLTLLASIMDKDQFKGHWKRISYEIFLQSNGKYFKSRQHCRNRWFNHIDPNISKQEWTHEEDQKMIEFILNNGARWSLIARTICIGRNEHMTKNRYRSLIRKFKISSRKSTETACQELLHYLRVLRAKDQENSKICVKIEEESQFQQDIGQEQQAKDQDFHESIQEEHQQQVKVEDNQNQLKNHDGIACLRPFVTQKSLSKSFLYLEYIASERERPYEKSKSLEGPKCELDDLIKEEDY